MKGKLTDAALDQLFRSARTHRAWLDKPVEESTLRELVELMNLGPTSINCLPARVVFVRSEEAKRRLEPHLSEGNRAKTMSAPVCAIIGYDTKFYEHLPRLAPHTDASKWAKAGEDVLFDTAFRNSSLQGGYFILAARALGLDTGAMSGFDNEGVDREFFPDGRIKSNFLCNLGYGDETRLRPRAERLSFEEVAEIL